MTSTTDGKRLEAFSDGVMAIAITLLVLDLKVPPHAEAAGNTTAHGLAAALGHEWPSYAAYLVSFLVIGIIWINHHAMFTQVRRVDRAVLFTNLGLLMVVSLIPFPTRLLADYLTSDDSDAHVAAAVYSATMLGMAVAFTGLWWAITRDAGLLHEHLDRAAGRAALRRFSLGLAVYGGCIGLSFVNAYATLAVHGALALYYCFDQLSTSAVSASAAEEQPR
ncbi:TMEM175 family protein [Pseudonocardia acaciae]|uniref:TMEM175 family protein n=1 Tax=Pseudonocardia acaciae TaxID=551276 RepID=UPI0007E8CDD7|nr:TMEM175 family protein [Pseudonocardia acaciae]